MKLNEAVILEFPSDTRHLIRDALRDHGYMARYYGASADLARDWETARHAQFFVIAEDIDGEGLATLRTVRAKASVKSAPVLAILGDQTEARVKDIVAAKPDGVLLRPYSMKDVMSRVSVLAKDAAKSA
jgi:DNA-binding response OmpR family regulator